jgi:hypothetical protein
VDDSRAEITHGAVGYDKDDNAYYIGSVLELPNVMTRYLIAMGVRRDTEQRKC